MPLKKRLLQEHLPIRGGTLIREKFAELNSKRVICYRLGA